MPFVSKTKVAGAWFTSIPRRTELDCAPIWREATPCIGDCYAASMTMTQTNCPLQPRSSWTDCKDTLPCVCNIEEFGLSQGVVTCGDCTRVPVGGRCFLGCSEPLATFRGSNVFVCLKNGFASSTTPTCATSISYCPAIAARGGLNVDMTTFCVGARPGQTCKFNCFPQYYNPQGLYEVTCSSDYTWSGTPQCACQTPCNYLGECRAQPSTFNEFGQ